MLELKNTYSRIISIEPVRRQSIISFTFQVLFTVIGFLSVVYFTHTIEAAVLGSYFLFLAYFSIISLFTNGGFEQAAIKRISEGIDQNEYFSAFIVLRTTFVTTTIIILFIIQEYFINSIFFMWMIIALIVSLFSISISAGISGCGKIGINSIGIFVSNVSRIIIQVITIYFGYVTNGLIVGFIVGMIVGFIFEYIFLNLKLVKFKWKHIKKLSTFSLWMFLISSGWIVFLNIDTVMISFFLGNNDVGIYRVILQFTSIAAITTLAIKTTLLPRISRWSITKETQMIEKSLSRAITFSLILAMPLFVGGLLLGDKLLYYFFGSIYGTGHVVLVILFSVQIVNIFHHLFITFLTGLDKVKEMVFITLLAVVTNIILNAVLIPQIGINGAALATLLTMLLQAYYIKKILMKSITIKLEKESVINIIQSSIIMGIVVLGLKTCIPINSIWILLIIVLISGIIYITRILNDKMVLNEIRRITNIIEGNL